MPETKSVHDLSHQRIYEILKKATEVAKEAAGPPQMKRSREYLRRKVKEHLGAAIEWIVAMDNIDRGY
jgi:hypothetical protein